jgi:2-succinyl-6-hydroxy-2,4-cyclohexadiene-1-carboxylate synthase
VCALGPATRGTVVFLHGFAGCADDWTGVMEMVRAEGYGSIAVDLPGHGSTGAPEDPDRYTAHSVVGDLTAILDALGTPAAHWVGYSMGARVALRAALEVPDRVRSLILESASTGIPDPETRRDRLERDLALAHEIEARGIEWFVAHWEAQPIFATQRGLETSIQDAQRVRRLRHRPDGLARALRGFGLGAEPDLTPRLSAVRVPTLVLAGELDSPYIANAERLASGLPDSDRTVIGGAGHNIHLERPEPFGRALAVRLARLTGSSTPARAHA